jgi:hypothetical protein
MKPKILFLLTFIMLLTSAFATDPWGDPVVLPGSMTVMAQVFINGIPASSNDVLAAMVEIAGTLKFVVKPPFKILMELPAV